jgi:hypothetical protein
MKRISEKLLSCLPIALVVGIAITVPRNVPVVWKIFITIAVA